jgi:hypothetical protein
VPLKTSQLSFLLFYTPQKNLKGKLKLVKCLGYRKDRDVMHMVILNILVSTGYQIELK